MASQNLFQSYLQPVRSVADYEGDIQQQDMRKLQLQGAARNNSMAALVQQQQMQGMARNALVQAAQRAAAVKAAGDEGAYAKNLRLSGFPELIDPADKVDKAATERGKAKSENAKRDTETENNVIAMWRDMIGNAVDQQQAAQMFTAMRADPRIASTPVAQVPLELGLRSLQEKPLEQWKKEFALGATKYVELNKPTYQPQNLGGTMQTLALPGLGGAPTVAAAAPITQSADNAATQATARANQARMSADAAAGRVQSEAHFNQRLAFDKNKQEAKTNAPPKPMPATAVKLQNEALSALGGFKAIDADLAALEKQIAGGQLEVGPVNRALAFGRSNLNISTENDRNISTLKTKIEGMRNAILLLGKGVQTEGDAQRAMDEILSNLNDQELLKQRIPELRAKLQRDANLQKNNVELLRSNYGQEPLDTSKYDSPPSSVDPRKPTAGPKPGAVVDGYRFKGGNPADKANWERQ